MFASVEMVRFAGELKERADSWKAEDLGVVDRREVGLKFGGLTVLLPIVSRPSYSAPSLPTKTPIPLQARSGGKFDVIL